MEQDKEVIRIETETVKLMKMSKGYNWELKILHKDFDTDEAWINRLEQLNNLMCIRFGNNES